MAGALSVCQLSFSRFVLVEQITAINVFAFKVDGADVLRVGYVLHGVSVQQDQCSIPAGLDESNVIVGTQYLGGIVSGSLKRNSRRDASFHPQFHFALNRRSVYDKHVAGVASGDERDTALISG
jgi:hypothetical protein